MGTWVAPDCRLTANAPSCALVAAMASFALACDGSGSPSSDRDSGVRPVIDASSQEGDPDGRPRIDGGDVGAAEKIIFATSSKQNGVLGGLAGADGICGDRAAAAGLDGTFKAWVSSSDEPAENRLAHADVPYVRTDGTPVADDWNDLVDGNLDAPISRDEEGGSVSGDVWTGTRPNGNTADATCGGFDTSDGFGVCGSSTATGGNWSDNIQPFCTSALRLYCVEQ